MKGSIFLYGPPGVGKSTIGRLLASAVNRPFIDLDDEISKHAQKTITRIFAENGEENFRALEQERLLGNIDQIPGVVSLGGGALLNPKNRELVEAHGQVIVLSAPLEILLERLAKSGEVRPLIAKDRTTRLAKLLSARLEHYASFHLQCDTQKRSPEEIVWEIQTQIGLFYIKGMGKGYWVNVESGGASLPGQELASLHEGRSAIIITDENVGPLYAQQIINTLEHVGFEIHQHMIKAGESHKNLETVTALWNAFTAAKLDRTSLVVVLGGGVVGDLSGFAAATYMRGIDWVNVPTSLLAMVDSSIGGKTGFDLPKGKNLVGAFHPPKYVLIDPEVLTTLPEKELLGGMAEAVKHAVIRSQSLFDQCQSEWNKSIEERKRFILEALLVKVEMVQKDPYEKGPRAALNLGHTIGHAVELLSNFQIPHGYAVAIGMVTEARLAQHLGIANQAFVEELTEVLSKLGLPTEIPGEMNKNKIVEAMRLDKKNANKSIRFSLPKSVGEVKIGVVIDDLENVLAQIS